MSLRWIFGLFGWPGYKDASPTGFSFYIRLPLFWRARDAPADFSQQLPAAGRVAALLAHHKLATRAARKIVFRPPLLAG
jgi:hypothetical protein